MVSTSGRQVQVGTLWPPDDTEESVVGTDRHQMTIINLRLGINEIAHTVAAPGQPISWQALSQTMVTSFTRRDGTRYTTLPDVFVYRRPIAPDRGSVSVLIDGPPALIIEVASESTYDSDLDVATGKGWCYANGGVAEYLVIDPVGLFLPEQVRGWRLVDRQYQTWNPDGEGTWWSEEIPVGFAIADGIATVYDRARRPQPREGEIVSGLTRINVDLVLKDLEIADLRRRLEERE
jgi:Uma2 family endonuclease